MVNRGEFVLNNEERKKEIYKTLFESEEPVTGTDLAKRFNVTRQIIVQDIALLRAEKNDIVSTARGYLIQKGTDKGVTRKIRVCHHSDKIEEELKIVVDLGGRVLDTYIEHPVYGNIGESLNVKSRRDVKSFLKKINETGCAPLLSLTNGHHMHTIEADDEASLNEICEELNLSGYLISK